MIEQISSSPPITIDTVFDAIRVDPNAEIHIDMRTEQKLTGGKSNPMQGRVFKETYMLPIEIALPGVAGGYAERLKAQATADGKDPDAYTPKARAWGTRVNDGPLIEHKGEYYLEFFVIGPGQTNYVYDVNDSGRAEEFVPIERTAIEGMPESKKPGSHTQDGLSKKIDVRCIKLSNIIRFHIGDKII